MESSQSPSTTPTPTSTPSNIKDIIGVSRSGRVRMKSSKLLGFQSPDDINEPPPIPVSSTPSMVSTTSGMNSPIGTAVKRPGRGRPPKAVTLQKQQMLQQNVPSPMTSPKSSGDDLIIDDADDLLEKTLNDLENDDEELETSFSDDAVDATQVKQSLYMSEKGNKKKVYKDGKFVFEKTPRKNKGKTRLTAFGLWVRETKKNVSLKSNDAEHHRLRDMWGHVPQNEKLAWKRKLKKIKKGLPGKDIDLAPKSTFLNRSVGRPRKTSEKDSYQKKIKSPKISPRSISPPTTRQQKNYGSSSPTDESSMMQTITPVKNNYQNHLIQSGIFKVTGQEPLDVAAHLKLLGDNLSIIGERLKEHEGQITVSGSLSVLLDSLLCSLGPLMCLTTQIPSLGTEHDQLLKANLQNTLNNIAYIMPGL